MRNLSDEPKERTFDTFGDDQAFYDANGPCLLAKTNAAALRNGTAIRLLAGGQDIGLRPSITAFHDLLATLNIPHQFTEVRGAGHLYRAIISGLGNDVFAFWNRAFGKFRWLVAREARPAMVACLEAVSLLKANRGNG